MRRLSWGMPLPHPTLFCAAAAVAFALCAVSIYTDSQQAANRVLAIREGSPAPTAIGAFDPAQHRGRTGEVTVRAQVDVSLPMQLFYNKGFAQERALGYPLVAVDAQRGAVPAPILGYFYAAIPQRQSEILDFVQIMPKFEKVGDYGPVVELNGELGDSRALTDHVSSLISENGRETVEKLLSIRPYPEGRAVALAAPRRSVWRVIWFVTGLAMIAGAIALRVALSRLEERRRLAEIARAGRKRSGVAPTPETDKGRRRLAPLAPQPAKEPAPRRAHRPLTALVLQKWHQMKMNDPKSQG